MNKKIGLKILGKMKFIDREDFFIREELQKKVLK